MRTYRLGAALLFVASVPASAAAQSVGAVALDSIDPTPAGDPFFGTPSPSIGGHLLPRVEVSFAYADAPLTIAQGGVERDVVSSQSFVRAGASLALWDRGLVSLLVPVAVAQSGEGVVVPGTSGTSVSGAPASPAFGDVRLGARVRLLGEERAPIQLAVGAYLHLPTGAENAYVSEGSTRVAPELVVGGRLEGLLVWSATVGATFRSSGNPSTVNYGGAAALLFWRDRLQVGPEIHAATPIQSGSLGLSEQVRVDYAGATQAEALLGARVWPSAELSLGAALGPGLGDGIGTPSFRAVGTLAWAPQPRRQDGAAGPPPDGDPDGDGLQGAEDACPYAYGPRSAELKRSGCPFADRDDDGFPDLEDACPDKRGVAGAAAAQRGCPPDADGDGVEDALDFCPEQPGSAGGAGGQGARPGCPASAAAPPAPPVTDTDGDGILDPDDGCPGEKGPKSSTAGERGCPARVRVQGDEVVLREPVTFKGMLVPLPPVEPRSLPVLEELAEVILQHPEWTKVEVQVHTDNTGDAKFNETVSGARAASVRGWLVDHGIAAARVVARGYGASRPIADNATAAGRERNRRVQIVVVERLPILDAKAGGQGR